MLIKKFSLTNKNKNLFNRKMVAKLEWMNEWMNECMNAWMHAYRNNFSFSKQNIFVMILDL